MRRENILFLKYINNNCDNITNINVFNRNKKIWFNHLHATRTTKYLYIFMQMFVYDFLPLNR